MPTEQQSWLNKYNTYHAATEFNRRARPALSLLESNNYSQRKFSNSFKASDMARSARILRMR